MIGGRYKSIPDDRVLLDIISGVLLPVTMFWFTRTAEYRASHYVYIPPAA